MRNRKERKESEGYVITDCGKEKIFMFLCAHSARRGRLPTTCIYAIEAIFAFCRVQYMALRLYGERIYGRRLQVSHNPEIDVYTYFVNASLSTGKQTGERD